MELNELLEREGLDEEGAEQTLGRLAAYLDATVRDR